MIYAETKLIKALMEKVDVPEGFDVQDEFDYRFETHNLFNFSKYIYK